MKFLKRNKAVLLIVAAFAAVAYLLHRSGQLSKLAVNLGITNGVSPTGGVRTTPLQITPLTAYNRDQMPVEIGGGQIRALDPELMPVARATVEDAHLVSGGASGTGTAGNVTSPNYLEYLRQSAQLVKTRVL